MAVLVAKISRLDCPDNWPELLPLLTEVTTCNSVAMNTALLPWVLLCCHGHCSVAMDTALLPWTHTLTYTQGVQSSSPLLQKCSLNAIKHVMKTLAGRRLAPQRKAFYNITMSLFVYLAKLWTSYLQEGLTHLSGEGLEVALVSLEMSRTCLKSGCGLFKLVMRYHNRLECIWTLASYPLRGWGLGQDYLHCTLQIIYLQS